MLYGFAKVSLLKSRNSNRTYRDPLALDDLVDARPLVGVGAETLPDEVLALVADAGPLRLGELVLARPAQRPIRGECCGSPPITAHLILRFMPGEMGWPW